MSFFSPQMESDFYHAFGVPIDDAASTLEEAIVEAVEIIVGGEMYEATGGADIVAKARLDFADAVMDAFFLSPQQQEFAALTFAEIFRRELIRYGIADPESAR